MALKFGVIGSGSWATALVKILTDCGSAVNWWVRNEASAQYIQRRQRNPHYLATAGLKTEKITIDTDLKKVVAASEVLVIAIPSAFVATVLAQLNNNALEGKIVLSAIKGILPHENVLLNDYLHKNFNVVLKNYFAVLGPCHAEEVAALKLSYLTFSGIDINKADEIASYFKSPYINTVTNNDIIGVQYAAVLKNIYAVGAGIAHGLDYGDNFQSVLIANCADEMAGFLRLCGAKHIVVGEHEEEEKTHTKMANYAASVYLGDLLVTCYSLHSRNRTFGNMIGKGYSVKAAQLELNMVAEGYNASKCIRILNEKIHAEMPIATAVYEILWEGLSPVIGFEKIEKVLV